MVVIAGYFRVPGGVNGEFLPHLKNYVSAVRGEPGCREFNFAVDVDDPELIRAFEIFNDRAAFDAHGQTPHLAAWKLTRAKYGVTERVINLYDVSSIEAV